jgi:hypothetical protein
MPRRNFRQMEKELLNMRFDGMMEQKILKHWREYEPERVAALLTKGILRQTLKAKADALLEMQMALEKTERLNPVLAEMEAWNRLMRPESEDENENEGETPVI